MLPRGLLNKAKKETIVIDVGNYYSWRDGRIDEIESGLTDSAWVEKQIGRPVINVLHEAEIVLLFRFPVTIPRRKKQSLNSLIGSASILLMPEQSLNRGGNNLEMTNGQSMLTPVNQLTSGLLVNRPQST